MTTNRRTDKADVVHIYNGILLSHKKERIGSFVETWMDLETVIQSEVSQKEKNKYHILTHVCGTWKNGRDEPVCRLSLIHISEPTRQAEISYINAYMWNLEKWYR